MAQVAGAYLVVCALIRKHLHQLENDHDEVSLRVLAASDQQKDCHYLLDLDSARTAVA